MKKFLLFLALLLTPLIAQAQGSRYDSILLGSTGRPVAGAQVTICSSAGTGIPCAPTVNIYQDQALTIPASNPIITDSLGNWGFWATPGTYTYTATGLNVIPHTPFTISVPCIPGGACAGAGSLPNTTLAFSATPAFNASSNISYTMTLTNNVTSSSVTGTPTNGNLLSLTLIQDAVGGHPFVFPSNFVLPVAYTFDLAALHTNALTFKYDGTNWNLISNAGGSGAGTSPGGTVLQGQVNGPPVGSFQGAGCHTYSDKDAGPINENCDVVFKGPNPTGIDVRASNVRGVPNLAPGFLNASNNIKANCTTGSNQLTSVIYSGALFALQNGDGIVVQNCGPAHAMTTPTITAVTPVSARGGTSLNDTIASPACATTFNYELVVRNKQGGLTPASAPVSTTTGCTLGSNSVSITAESRSGNIMTYTTGSAHNLAVNGLIYINGSHTDMTFAGWYNVNTVPDNTHFTIKSMMSTVNGASPTSTPTAASVFWWQANKVTWSLPGSPSGEFQYYVYSDRANPGTYALIGPALPISATNSAYTDMSFSFEDYGATMMANVNLQVPWYVPQIAPTTATNNLFVSKITAGATTSTITTLDNAGNTLSGQFVLFDNTPNILTAAAGSTSIRPALNFPVDPNSANTGGYITNSVLDLTTVGSFTGIMNIAGLSLHDTMILGSYYQLYGNRFPSQFTGSSFEIESHPTIGVSVAPGIYFVNQATAISIRGLQIVGNGNGSVPVLVDGAFEETFEDDTFSPGGGTNYVSISLLLRANSSNSAGPSNVVINRTMISGGMSNNLGGSTATPSFYCRMCGGIYMKRIQGFGKGYYIRDNGTGGQHTIEDVYSNGGNTPLFTLATDNVNAGAAGGAFIFRSLNLDTLPHPDITILQSANNPIFQIRLTGTNGPSSSVPIFSGYNNAGQIQIAGGILTATYGVNTQLVTGDGVFADNDVRLYGSGQVVYAFPLPGTPTCPVAAGGLVPIATHNYTITWVDMLGKEGPPSAPCAATTSSGNQTVNVTPPAAPANQGIVGYYVYRDGNRTLIFGGSCSVANQLGTVMPDTTNVVNFCGTPYPLNPLGGSVDIGSTGGVAANSFILAGAAGSGVQAGVNLLARTITTTVNASFPNVSGVVMESSGSWIAGHCVQANSSSVDTTFSDSGGACPPIPSLPTSPNGVAQILCSTPSGGVGGNPLWCLQGVNVNAQTGTSYTIAATDRASYVTYSNASPIAVTLPQAGSGGGTNNDFTHNFVFVSCAIGAGTATITPTTSTISYTDGTTYTSGASSLALSTGQCVFIYSDNVNYKAILIKSGSGGGTVNNCSTTGAMAYYAATGTTVSCNANVVLSAGGTLTTYGGVTVTDFGVPGIVAADHKTAQTASIGTVTLLTGPAAGMYEIRFYGDQNANAASGSCAVSYTFNWTDASNARQEQTGNLVLATSQSTSSFLTGLQPIWVGSGNVTYITTLSGTCPSGSYDSHVQVLRTK